MTSARVLVLVRLLKLFIVWNMTFGDVVKEKVNRKQWKDRSHVESRHGLPHWKGLKACAVVDAHKVVLVKLREDSLEAILRQEFKKTHAYF